MASQAGRRAKNKLGLKLNVCQETPLNPDQPHVTPINKIADMNIDETQKLRLMSFLENKGKIGVMKPEQFERLKDVGSGSSGVVYKVRHIPTGLIMAQKVIRLDVKASVRTQIIRELQVLHECNSPYIVGYFGAFHVESEIYMLMEYMNCGSLDSICCKAKRINENILGRITHDVLEGLSYLRSKHQVIHRDIKPSNVLINSNGEIKICDFGVSGKLIDSMANSFVGTRSYMAPERLQGNKYSVRSDIWSMGLLMVEMATGRYPYPPIPQDKLIKLFEGSIEATDKMLGREPEQDLAIFELLDYIVHDEPPLLKEPYFSSDLCDFVSQCLKKHPGERSDLESLLNHNYILKNRDFDISGWITKLMNADLTIDPTLVDS